jgi:hypothetical protein
MVLLIINHMQGIFHVPGTVLNPHGTGGGKLNWAG